MSEKIYYQCYIRKTFNIFNNYIEEEIDKPYPWEEKPFTCTHCDKKFTTKYNLNRHIAKIKKQIV
jgi:hypothetical protein